MLRILHRRRKRREINETLDGLVAKLGIPREYLGTDLRIKFATDHKGSYHAGEDKRDRQIIITNPYDHKFQETAAHELGHYIFFNVAAAGDPEKRKSFFANQQAINGYFSRRAMKSILVAAQKAEVISEEHMIEWEKKAKLHQKSLSQAIEQEAVNFTIIEMYAAFCAMAINKDNFLTLQAYHLRHSEKDFNTLIEAASHYFDRKGKQPLPFNGLYNEIKDDTNYTNYLFRTEEFGEYIRRVVCGSQKPKNLDIEQIKNLRFYAGAFGEYLAAKMIGLAEERSMKSVSDQMLGIGEFKALSAELRIGTSEYDAKKQLDYLAGIEGKARILVSKSA